MALAVIYFFLFLVSAYPVDAAISCVSKAEPAKISTAVANPEFIVTFDDATGFDGTAKIVSAAGSPVDVTLIGPSCVTIQGFSLSDYAWTNTKNWYPENDASPVRFIAVNADSNGYCDLVFSEPISYFSMRVAGTSASPAGIFIYNDADQELNCDLIPWMGAGGNDNAYGIRGFESATKTIKKIRIKDSYSTGDLLRGSRCAPGRTLVGSSCLLPCEMDPAPCGSNTNCANVQGTAECTCKTYYTGNATEGCIPKTCTYSAGSCNQYATCTDEASEPFFSCACNEGFSGSGYGADGCTAIPIAPIAPPVAPIAAPVGSPQSSEPISEPTSAPVASPISGPIAAPISSPTVVAPVTTPIRKVSAGSVVNLTVITVILSLASIF